MKPIKNGTERGYGGVGETCPIPGALVRVVKIRS
jgi:hypothetical protein